MNYETCYMYNDEKNVNYFLIKGLWSYSTNILFYHFMIIVFIFES